MGKPSKNKLQKGCFYGWLRILLIFLALLNMPFFSIFDMLYYF